MPCKRNNSHIEWLNRAVDQSSQFIFCVFILTMVRQKICYIIFSILWFYKTISFIYYNFTYYIYYYLTAPFRFDILPIFVQAYFCFFLHIWVDIEFGRIISKMGFLVKKMSNVSGSGWEVDQIRPRVHLCLAILMQYFSASHTRNEVGMFHFFHIYTRRCLIANT